MIHLKCLKIQIGFSIRTMIRGRGIENQIGCPHLHSKAQ